MKHGKHTGSDSLGKKIWNIVSGVLVAAVILLAILLVGVRVVGLRPFAVLSGSMVPKYPVGSLIYVQSVDANKVQVGDDITFVLNEDLVVATHRVIKIDAENQHFYTQGIANAAPDGSPVHFNNLIGRPVFCIPLLGYVSNYVSEPPGLYIAISGVIILLLLMFVPDWICGSDEKENSKKQEKDSVEKTDH